nr:hypothetical protein [Tanacetum cinerariifolium]
MGTIDDMKSSLTQSALDALCEKFHIPGPVHPELPGQMDLFAFINHADPTKVRIGEREVREGEVPLLESSGGRVVSLAGNPVDAGIIRIEDEVPATVADKAKRSMKKRKATEGASGSNLPPKKLRADHGTSGAGASSGGKSVAALQGLLERSTLLVEVGVTAVATLPFVTSFVSLTLERVGGGRTDYVTGPICVLSTQWRDPLIMTTFVATTVVADTSSISVPRAGDEPVHASIFADSTSVGTVGPDFAGPSHPAGTELSTDTFYISQDMDSETLRQIYFHI